MVTVGPRDPETQTMNASQARADWSRTLERVYRRQARVLVKKHGIPVAAIVSVDDLARLARLDAQRAADFEALDVIRATFEDVPDEELEREVAKAIAAVRARPRDALPPGPPSTA